MTPWSPAIVTVAPNGATKSSKDHASLPITTEAIVATAKGCLEAGAAMIHLHVRDGEGRHLLDAPTYLAATAAIRAAVGDRLVIQITTESARIYERAEQMAVARAVRPEALSAALRELAPDEAALAEAAEFFSWMRRERIMSQVILYDAADLIRYQDLLARGVLADGPDFLLFVLGRYRSGQTSEAADLFPFMAAKNGSKHWSVCAFGPREGACVLAAATLGGHLRVGFENNLFLADGTLAPDNAALVRQAVAGLQVIGRPLADATWIRETFS